MNGRDPPRSSRPGPVRCRPLAGAGPGRFNLEPEPVRQQAGIPPTSIQIEQAGVDSEIERLQVIDGQMQDPTGPWVVSWYENLAALGEGGNVVMAGHIDYWNVGPAVFFSIGQLGEGDEVTVTGEDGELYTYAVEWVREYTAADAPLDEIVGSTGTDTLTLITCGGNLRLTRPASICSGRSSGRTRSRQRRSVGVAPPYPAMTRSAPT